MRGKTNRWNWWLLAGLMALLAACGSPKTQTIKGDPPGEFAITGIVAYCVDGGEAGVRISWSESERALTYSVLRDEVQIAQVGAITRSFDDVSGLKPGTVYVYLIRAVNADGQLDSSAETFAVPADLCETNLPEPEVPVPPGPIGELTADLSCTPGRSVNLSWPAVADADTLVLERDYTELALLEGDALGWSDTDVSPASSHTYVLRALNATGLAISAPVSISIGFDICGLAGPVIDSYQDSNLLIAADGSLWAWGRNVEGQLGQGDTEERYLPVQLVGVPRMVAVAVGAEHQLALDENGQVWAWGENEYGQLGLGYSVLQRTLPTALSTLDDVVSIAAGDRHSLAVRADGTVWAWGNNGSGQIGLSWEELDESFEPLRVTQLSGVVRVAAGYATSFAVQADGTVFAWGNNYYGELGLGDDLDRHVPEQIADLEEVVQLAAAEDFTVALQADGTVWSFGRGGRLGLGAGHADALSPVQHSALTEVVGIAAGTEHVLVLTGDGTLWGWGENTQTQLGPNLAVTVHDPIVLPGVPGARQLAAGGSHSLLVDADGRVHAWGDNAHHQLGWNSPNHYSRFTEHPFQGDIVSIASEMHSLALMADGSVWAWGYGSEGQLGLGDEYISEGAAEPTQIEGLSGIRQIAVSNQASLALDGDGNVWSWGGHLGSGHPDTLDRSVPAQLADLSGVTAIARGYNHGLAIVGADGAVWAWGENGSGQLGDGSGLDSLTPVEVTGLPEPAVAIAAGSRVSFAVLDDGSVWAWGRRNYGLMGDLGATTGFQPVPVKSGAENVLDVITANNSVWALHTDGTVSAWGYNYGGVLGLGSGAPIQLTYPQKIAGLSDITSIDAISSSTTVLAVDGDGVMFGWGDGHEGSLGLDVLGRYYAEPWRYDFDDEVTLALGGYRSYAVIGGTLYATGYNGEGYLGFGYLFDSPLPRLIEDLPEAATGH